MLQVHYLPLLRQHLLENVIHYCVLGVIGVLNVLADHRIQILIAQLLLGNKHRLLGLLLVVVCIVAFIYVQVLSR
jgi:hypothetical protein